MISDLSGGSSAELAQAHVDAVLPFSDALREAHDANPVHSGFADDTMNATPEDGLGGAAEDRIAFDPDAEIGEEGGGVPDVGLPEAPPEFTGAAGGAGGDTIHHEFNFIKFGGGSDETDDGPMPPCCVIEDEPKPGEVAPGEQAAGPGESDGFFDDIRERIGKLRDGRKRDAAAKMDPNLLVDSQPE